MFRIRLHGRGGQGIKTAGQILGSAFFLSGFEVQDAPRYGAERRGAPVLAGVRAARAAIDERGTIARADLIVVADATLFQVPTAGVLQAGESESALLIRGGETGSQWRERLGFAGPVYTIHPEGEALFPAIPLIGAAARLTGVIARDNLARALRAELAAFDAPRVAQELQRALRAFDAFALQHGAVQEALPGSARGYVRPEWIDLAAEPARTAAPLIRAGANSAASQTGFWRTQRPVIDYDRCGRCSWICSTLCPDSAINVAADRTPVIDYEHCKGCLVCVTVCPPHAIAVVPESGAHPPPEAPEQAR